ncbi:MAG TPA: phosphotransferase, partial [Chlamydiales bacterium]|nr:phosphotransferase [Chlamydiales bacterium]
SLSDQLIISCLNTNYGIDVATLTSLPVGADMNASVYKAQALDQTSYFVKLKRGHHHDISVVIVELLHDAGIGQIIPPIKTIHGQPIQRIEGCSLVVYPFIEGQDGFSRNLTDNQWLTLGKALRQVHEIDVPLSIQNRIRREAYSPQWRKAVRSLYMHIEAEPIGDEIAIKLLQFMKENALVIGRLVDRAEQLGQKLQDTSPENQSLQFVLCHSDIHGGNVLMDRNDTIYIVDWDEPIMAPKERDLMFIDGGVGNVWNKPHEETLFYKGYGKTEVHSTSLAYYRHERIVEDIALICQELLLTTANGKNRPNKSRQNMYKQFIDMFEPRGVVDIAFKTDEERDEKDSHKRTKGT